MQMATLFKIPRSYLSRIENNRLLPGPLMVAQFAEALGVGVSELLPPEPSRQKAAPMVSDPATAALLKYFAELAPGEMELVLSRARQMAGRANPLPAADAQRESLRGQESRLPAARTEQGSSTVRTPMLATAAASARRILPASVGFPASARQASLRRLAR
jgi:transcriptional regulator with XRE-family HTH domain